MLGSPLNLINQGDAIGLFLKIGFNVDVEISLLLKVVTQIVLTFLHQISIDGAFRKNRDQGLEFSGGEEGNCRDLRSCGPNRNYRANDDLKGNVDPVRSRIVVRWVLLDRACESILLR